MSAHLQLSCSSETSKASANDNHCSLLASRPLFWRLSHKSEVDETVSACTTVSGKADKVAFGEAVRACAGSGRLGARALDTGLQFQSTLALH